MYTEQLKKIDDVLKEMIDSGFASGANCMILKDGGPLYYGEAGFGDIANKKPIKEDSIFRLYSMSKPITSAAIMLLMEDGKLDINEPVGNFIPSYKNQLIADGWNRKIPNRPMKVKDLLDMTAGLTYCGENNVTEAQATKLCNEAIDRLNSDNEMSTMEFATRLGEVPLLFSPGETFNYSFCADVLGAIVEVVSGMRFGDFLKKRIFEPLGMDDTGFYVPADKQDRLTKVYKQTENGLEEFFYNNLAINLEMSHEPAFQSGGAGLVTTILDYAKFATMLLNKGEYNGKQVMLPGTVKYMTEADMLDGPKKGVAGWDGMEGWVYANLLRILKNPGQAVTMGVAGEYGWDGWLGPYFINDPLHNITILHMVQRADTGLSPYVRRIRNIVYSCLEY